MAFKSIYKIDVDQSEFDRFKAEFDKFSEMLGKMPGDWAKAGQAQAAATLAAAAANRQLDREKDEQAKKEKEEQDRLKKQAQETAAFWGDIGRSTDRVLANIGGITRHFLSWSGMTGLLSGLLGAGGLYGFDRLALRAGSDRVNAQGIGTSIGAQRAFENNYGNVLRDPNGLLSSVSNARNNPSEWSNFTRLGITDFRDKDPVQLAMEVVEKSAAAFQRNPVGYSQTGMDHWLGAEDARRAIGNNLGDIRNATNRDLGFGLDDPDAKKWQDFVKAMNRAGNRVETAFEKGLINLGKPLEDLSSGLVKLVDVASTSPKVREWLDDLTGALDRMSKWLDGNGPSFVDSVLGNKLQDGTPGTLGAAAAGMAVAGLPGAAVAVVGSGIADTRIIGRDEDRKYSAWDRLLLTIGSSHNPGNLRKWGDTPTFGGFARFKTDEEGAEALDKQLLLYADRDHLNTVRSIISKYAPPSENDTEKYIRFVTGKMGVKDRDTLDLHNTQTLAELMLAIIRKEHGSSYNNLDKNVLIKIANGVGANITTNSNQAAASTP